MTLLEALKRSRQDLINHQLEQKEQEKRIETLFQVIQELIARGIPIKPLTSYYDCLSPMFCVAEKTYWRAIHDTVGALTKIFLSPIGDGRKRQVKVVLSPKNKKYKHISFYYFTKLTKGGKCKIKTVKSSTSIVVCER